MPAQRRQVAVITGGGQGIGLAICRRLGADGRYAIAVIEQSELGDSTAAELQERGVEAISVRADVSDEAAIASAAQAIGAFGTVACVVNNAGIYPRAEAMEMPFDQWMRVVEVNLGGTFLVSRAFAPAMLAAGGGAVVNIASGRAFEGAVRGSHYSASKGGIISLTRSLAREWAPAIRVNAVVPGVTDTAQPRQATTEEELYSRGARIPLGRIGQPEDVAGVVAFLLSDDARYVTGQSYSVNGGSIMR